MADLVYLYLAAFVNRDRVIAGVAAALGELDPERDAYLASHLLCVLFEATDLPLEALIQVRRMAWSVNAPAWLRAIALRVLGKNPMPADLVALRARLHRESDRPVIRALLGAVAEADPTRARATLSEYGRLDREFAKTTEFLLSSGVPPLTPQAIRIDAY